MKMNSARSTKARGSLRVLKPKDAGQSANRGAMRVLLERIASLNH
jgi:hypothetical protein